MDARKKKIECDNAAEEMRLDRKKKNVFIMAHCLSDAPHTSERLLFKDYYEALKETLCIASKIKNVNWILKIHPDFERYHGDNGVRLLREYGGDNIALFDNRWSNEVAYRLADVMITVRGTIGVEASAYGIPVVLTGESWYSKFGFTINAFSREKYTKVLNNLHRIRRLSDEKRDLAQRVLCAYLMGCNEIKIDKDDFGKDLYENMLSDKSIKAKNRSTMRILREYTAVHDLENCYISRRCLELFDELR
ncbi:hypothetical protein D7X88_17215 [bacterium C-53]|nr:hypothetical protein [Lachnospiraceae bacterium]NBI04694.1 hypothetical protein [Lachnospiraceae bacterium]RKJ07916.1 hypothetical protein D7X88_17215 [bacterium C-53]